MSNKIIKKIGLSSIGAIGANAINLIVMLFLARMLTPEIFGIMAVIGIISVFAMLLVEGGMGAALIHQDQFSLRHSSTAFWFNLSVGLVLSLLIAGVFSRDIALFFGNENMSSVISVGAFLLTLNALSVVPFSWLQKNHMFGKISSAELAGATVGGIVAVSLAYQGFGVWSLVIQLFVRDIIRIMLLFFWAEWHPRLIAGFSELKELLGYSGYLVLANTYATVGKKIDSFFVAKFLGVHQVGLYDYANKIAETGPTVGLGLVNRVLFPLYAERKSDIRFIKSAYLKSLGVSLELFIPLMLFLSVEADDFVNGVLGGGAWAEVAMPLSMLSLVYMLRTLAGLNRPVFMALGRTRTMMYLTFLMRSNVMIAVIIGIQYGMSGLLWALLIVRLINMFPALYPPMRMVRASAGDILHALWRPAFSVLFFGVLLALVSRMLNLMNSPLTEFLLSFFIVFSIYGLMIFLIRCKGSLICPQ